ncbi:mRNA-decapping enzyme 1A-like [Lineus longissimus]|uniref:mRNA-decapping enzyme 1A-like n=1 Tax=Lineus longissimus TaxID=88925 RepID=UPI00315D9D83
MAEGRINLAALQQRDPYITDIVETASQVALYSFSPKANEWEKTDIEGTLFVYSRSASPINGFMILNRLGLNNLIEPLIKDLEFQLQDPFLLYKNANSIYGIWFYDKDECARIGQLMNSLVQVTRTSEQEPSNLETSRPRRASESDTMYDRRDTPTKNPVDILQMLSKAQDEYDKSKGHISPPKRGPAAAGAASGEPKPMIDNPNASATATADSASLVRPTAIKLEHESIAEGSSGGAAGGSISLQTLFGKLSASREAEQASLQQGKTVALAESGDVLLKRLMSNPGNTLEEIERKQREVPDGKTFDVGTLESQSRVGKIQQRKKSIPKDQKPPYSPDTDLKMKLNIISSPSQSMSNGASSKYDSQKLRSVHSSSDPQKQQPVAVHSVASAGNMSIMVSSQGGSALSNVLNQSLADALAPQGTGLPPMPTSTTSTVVSTSLLTPAELSTPKSLQAQSLALATTLSGQPPPASPIKPVPPPADVLMSPMAFQQSSGGATSAPLHQSSSAQALQQLSITKTTTSSISPPTLTTPQAMTSLNFPSFSQVPVNGSGDQASINPLTRDQLQQSLVYLVKNDRDFMEKIHDAYVKSLKRQH